MRRLAEELGLGDGALLGSQAEVVNYLKRQPVQSILDATDKLDLKFEPVYGDDLVPQRPVDAVKCGAVNAGIDLMYGVMRDEGQGFTGSVCPELKQDDLEIRNHAEACEFIRKLFAAKEQPFAEEAIEFYSKHWPLPENASTLDYRLFINQAYGDWNMVMPVILFAENYAKTHFPGARKRKFFSYVLNAPAGVHIMGALAANWRIAAHADELYYLFTITRQESEQDRRLSEKIIGAWARFAKYGDPGSIDDIRWEPALGTGKDDPVPADHHTNYMLLDYQSKMVFDAYRERISFWSDKTFI